MNNFGAVYLISLRIRNRFTCDGAVVDAWQNNAEAIEQVSLISALDLASEHGYTRSPMRSSDTTSRSSNPGHEPECAEIQGVLHDVANSLTAVLGWLSCACGRLGRDEPGAHEAQIALKNAQQARLMVLSALAPEHQHLTHLAVTWKELLDDVTTAVMPAAEQNNVCVRLESDAQTGALLVREPVAVHRVLTNLLFNAVSFAPYDSEVEVRLRLADGDFVNVCVSDEGPGLNPSDVDSVFGGIRSTRHSGEGIGLRVAHELAKRHGGRLELMGAGPGATFSLTWPKVVSSEVQHVDNHGKMSRSANNAMPLDGVGVAVLEDDVELAQLVDTGLTLRGATVWSVFDVVSLGEVLATEKVHAVLLDLSPISGTNDQARVAMQLIDNYSHIRWLGMTGAAWPLDKGLRERLFGVIRKPFEIGDVVLALATARVDQPADESAMSGKRPCKRKFSSEPSNAQTSSMQRKSVVKAESAKSNDSAQSVESAKASLAKSAKSRVKRKK